MYCMHICGEKERAGGRERQRKRYGNVSIIVHFGKCPQQQPFNIWICMQTRLLILIRSNILLSNVFIQCVFFTILFCVLRYIRMLVFDSTIHEVDIIFRGSATLPRNPKGVPHNTEQSGRFLFVWRSCADLVGCKVSSWIKMSNKNEGSRLLSSCYQYTYMVLHYILIIIRNITLPID